MPTYGHFQEAKKYQELPGKEKEKEKAGVPQEATTYANRGESK
jgi:hypothetical protein